MYQIWEFSRNCSAWEKWLQKLGAGRHASKESGFGLNRPIMSYKLIKKVGEWSAIQTVGGEQAPNGW